MTVSEQIDAFIEQHGGNCRDALNVALARLDLAEAKLKISSNADFYHLDEIYGKWYRCPSCLDINIMREDNYCRNCGAKFEWADM